MSDVRLRFSVGGPPCYRSVGDPRELWPAEGDFCRWLAASAPLLADCTGVLGLEVTGREVAVGEQVAGFDRLGRRRWDGGVRPDLIARDAYGGAVVIEAQLGEADHDHLGKLVTYAHAVEAAVAVWAVAAAEPPFLREHLDALAGLNEAFAGRRRFTAVSVTLESEPSPVPVAPGRPPSPDDPGRVEHLRTAARTVRTTTLSHRRRTAETRYPPFCTAVRLA